MNIATIPRFLLDKVVNAGRENLDPGHVSRYNSRENAVSADAVLLYKKLGLTDESIIVEIGAGTGQFATAIAALEADA